MASRFHSEEFSGSWSNNNNNDTNDANGTYTNTNVSADDEDHVLSILETAPRPHNMVRYVGTELVAHSFLLLVLCVSLCDGCLD